MSNVIQTHVITMIKLHDLVNLNKYIPKGTNQVNCFYDGAHWQVSYPIQVRVAK